jgi:hypothetical protein
MHIDMYSRVDQLSNLPPRRPELRLGTPGHCTWVGGRGLAALIDPAIQLDMPTSRLFFLTGGAC